MKTIKLICDQGIGLVEVLVSIAIVGTAMVIMTSLTLGALQVARKNEYQDVAIQSAVEAMDFLKDPVEISADLVGTSTHLYDSTADIFALDVTASPPYIKEQSTNLGNTCPSTSPFKVADVTEDGFLVCRQISILSENGSKNNFIITVTVVWSTLGGEFETRTFESYRYGSFYTY